LTVPENPPTLETVIVHEPDDPPTVKEVVPQLLKVKPGTVTTWFGE
jgi:hypothetical protein